jgi:hypothetical protein
MNAVVSSHLNRVKFFKITLGAGAIFLLLAVVGMPVYNSQHEKLKFFYGEKDNLTEVVKQAEEPKIEKPKFYGMDSKKPALYDTC